MDNHAQLRSISLLTVFDALGVRANWKARKGGTEFAGRCPNPDHNPKHNTGSFSFTTDGLIHCFGCNWKGKGAIDAVRALKRCSFSEAVEFLRTIQPTVDTKKPPVAAPVSVQTANRIVRDYSKPMDKDSWRKFAVHSDWLAKRCPHPELLDKYGVFLYDNQSRKSAYSGRVMIPFRHHETGALHGYMGRATEGEPKYLVPDGFPKASFLFGAYELKASAARLPLKVVYLVESWASVLHFASLSLPAVSSYGWAVSEEQLAILEQLAKGCIYLPDSNKQAACASVCHALSRKLWLRFPELPQAIHDPEHLTREQILAL